MGLSQSSDPIEVNKVLAKTQFGSQDSVSFSNKIPSLSQIPPGSVLLVTGKGFPDLVCRQFLKCLSQSNPSLPFYALVDSDPDGIAIFLNYKYGTRNQQRNGTCYPIPKIKYIGVSLNDYSNDLSLPIDDETLYGSQYSRFNGFPDPTSTWMQLSFRDLKMAFHLIQDPRIRLKENKAILRELQMGLFLGKKAEMNNAVAPVSDPEKDESSQTTVTDKDTSPIADYSMMKLSQELLKFG